MFYGLSTMQDYFARKLSVAIMLGPVTKLTANSVKLLHFLVVFYAVIDDFFDLFNIYEILGANWFTSQTYSLICHHIPLLCKYFQQTLTTETTDFDDPASFDVWVDHEPHGVSMKTIKHYA